MDIERRRQKVKQYMRPSFLSPLSLWSSVNPQKMHHGATSWCIVSDYGRYATNLTEETLSDFFMTGNGMGVVPFR